MEKEKYYVSTLGLTLTQLFLFFTIGGVLMSLPILVFSVSKNLETNLFINNCFRYLITNILIIIITFLAIFRSKRYWFIKKEAWKSVIINFCIQIGLMSLLLCFNGIDTKGISKLILALLIGFISYICFFWIISNFKKLVTELNGEVRYLSVTSLGFIEFAIQVLAIIIFKGIADKFYYSFAPYFNKQVFFLALILYYFLSNAITTISILVSYKKYNSLFLNKMIQLSFIWSFCLQSITVLFLSFFYWCYIKGYTLSYKILMDMIKHDLSFSTALICICFFSTIGTCWIINKITNKRGE